MLQTLPPFFFLFSVIFLADKGYPCYVAAVETGDNHFHVFGADSAVFPVDQEMVTVFAVPPLKIVRHAGPGTHGDIPGNVHIPVRKLRVCVVDIICQLK